MKKVFIFDLGKVLLDFDFRIALARIRNHTNCKDQEIFQFFRNSRIAEGWDKGTISEKEFYASARSGLNLKIGMEEFKEIWNEIFSEKKEVIDFALSLKKFFKIAVLSNTNPWHLNYIRAQYNWMQELGSLIASCEVGLLKPDPEIFKIALKILGVSPEETFYTDDLSENVKAAKRVGIEAYVFKGLEGLRQELKSQALGLTEDDLSGIRK